MRLTCQQRTALGTLKQPHTEREPLYRIRMKTQDSRKVLAANLAQLMSKTWGAPNLNRLASKVLESGNAQATRVMGGETNTGVQTIDKAATFFHFQPWQLLVPEFDAQSPPALLKGPAQAATRFSDDLLAQIAELDGAALTKLENVVRAHLGMRPLESSFQQVTDAETSAQKSSRGQTGHRGTRRAA